MRIAESLCNTQPSPQTKSPANTSRMASASDVRQNQSTRACLGVGDGKLMVCWFPVANSFAGVFAQRMVGGKHGQQSFLQCRGFFLLFLCLQRRAVQVSHTFDFRVLQ